MMSMIVEILPPLPGKTETAHGHLCHDDIMRLNGKRTIYQMMQLAERIKERGGVPREPLWYKHEYLRRLDERIQDRLKGLRSGAAPPEDWLVYGAQPLLEALQRRGLPLY